MNEDPGRALATFFDAWELFRAPVIAGALAGALVGLLGVYVVLRQMVFLAGALSQSAGLGVALAFYGRVRFGLEGVLGSPTFGAALATLFTATLLVGGRTEAGARRDGLLGMAWLVGAAGTLAVGTRIAEEVQDIQSILFGSAVVVLDDDLTRLIVLAVPVGLLHVWWRRGFLQAAFDAEGARVRGLPVWLLDAVLVGTIALSISLCTRVLGALPVFAFSVLPAMAALRVSAHIERALWVAAVIGAACGAGGYVLAWRFDLPVGASQTLLAAAAVLVASGVRSVMSRVAP
ncbi:MAG: metal ABC transporter permease [Bradymonadia bacterium]